MLTRRVGDHVVLGHFEAIIRNFEIEPGIGLPIGSLTSQHFANHYLGHVDHHIKEQLGCRRYVRYMDDFVLWHDDRSVLLAWRDSLKQLLADRFRLALNEPVVGRAHAGLGFCGYRVFPDGLRLSQRSRRRFRTRYAELIRASEEGRTDDRELVRRVEPMLSCVRRASSRSYRQRVLAAYGEGP